MASSSRVCHLCLPTVVACMCWLTRMVSRCSLAARHHCVVELRPAGPRDGSLRATRRSSSQSRPGGAASGFVHRVRRVRDAYKDPAQTRMAQRRPNPDRDTDG